MNKTEEIGQRIKHLRDAKPMKTFAEELGISFAAYQNYEYGKRIPPGSVLSRLSEISGRSVDWILSGTESGADRVAETQAHYGDVRDKIMDMLGEMDEEGRQHIFDHVQATQRLLNDVKKKATGG